MVRESRFVLVSLMAASVALGAPTRGSAQQALDTDPVQGTPRDRTIAKKEQHKRRGVTAPPRIGAIPRYEAPPGAGAGKTGFVSVYAKRAAAPARRSASASVRNPESAPLRAALRPGAGAPAQETGHPRRSRTAEGDPVAPIGFYAGAFAFFAGVDLKAGYDSNPARASVGRGSAMTVIVPELVFRSIWQRHELTGVLRGGFTNYDKLSELDGREFDGKLTGRVDMSRNTRLDFETRARIESVNPAAPDLPADLAKRPLRSTYGFIAGPAHRFNRFELALKGSFDHVQWADSQLTDGSRASNAERNYDVYGTLLRGSYELLPGVKPFVETGIDTREHELAFDTSGFRRDSRGAVVKAGTTFELTRKFTGEAAIGHIARTYKDQRLPDLRGLLTEAALSWSVSPLTTVKFTAKTSVDETISPGISGTLVRDAGVEVEHAFRRWLIGNVRFGYGTDTYAGSAREDERYLIGATMTYKMSRHAQLKGEARREWRTSNVAGNDYAATIVLGGVRLQH